MINDSYTIFTRIVLFRTPNGKYYTGALWQKDLVLHFDYISDLRICCPVENVVEVPADCLSVPQLSDDTVYPLKPDGGWGSVLSNLVPSLKMVAKASKESQIVHSGGAGWAFPLSFYLLFLRPFQSFKWIVVIESSFWMRPQVGKASLRTILRHFNYSFLLGRCLRAADVCIFTQDGYRRYFGIESNKSLVNPAVWIDEADIITEDEQRERLASRVDGNIKVLFAARLIEDKGVETVIAMVDSLEDELKEAAETGLQIQLSIIGEGPLRERCEHFAQAHKGNVQVEVLDTVPYGAPFLTLVRGQDALVLANRQQEQPRIIFDAFCQGVPVISSRTSGVCDVITEGENALLYPVDDAGQFAKRVFEFASNRELRINLSNCSLQTSIGISHRSMHLTRAKFLEEKFG